MSTNEERLGRLLVRGLEGDEAAYHAFLKDLSGYLRAFLRRRLLQVPDEVEDIVQETLLAVHNQRHTYAPAQPVTAWVHAIAKYKMIDFLRRRGRREVFHVALEDAPDLFAANDTDAREARRDLFALMQSLPPRQRGPIECVKLKGLSVAEAGRELGMSASAVKVAVHRGLKALAAKIRNQA